MDITGSSSDRLNQGRARTEEALLVRIEDSHQRHFGDIEPFAKQVDPDQDIEFTLTQIADELDPLDRVNIRVEIADPDPEFLIVFGQIFGHSFGQSSDQNTLIGSGPLLNFT